MVATVFFLNEKMRHSLGRLSRSDFVQFKFVDLFLDLNSIETVVLMSRVEGK